MNKLLFLSLLFSINFVFSQEKDTIKPKEKSFVVVPLITSTPLIGFGVGVTSSYLYHADNSNASKSQLKVGGQYTTRDSYNIFGTNHFWLKSNKYRIVSALTYSSINNQFDDNGEEVRYNINSTLLAQVQLVRVYKNLYIGGPLLYKRINYKPNNDIGNDFLTKNGIENEQTGGFGLASSYDSRKNKYYPTNSVFITGRFDHYPDWLGSINTYNKFILDSRGYVNGFSHDDVIAMHVYGEYASEMAPDAGLPSISGKSVLRGFPQGQLKAQYMTGGQVEYRYTIGQTRFRLTSFVGVVNLSGGSYGNGEESRSDDGWYTSVGIGARYKIQPVTGVDLRLDVTRTSLGQYALYLKLNQAF